MYDFARRPVWILSHVLVLVAVLVMVRLGFWQMDRWNEESERLDGIEAGLDAAPVPLDEVVDADTPPRDVPEDARFRRVVVEGEWDSAGDAVLRNRSLAGSPGGWLVTPLVQPDGTAVAVVRGWIGLELANAGAPFAGTAPPEGPVVVTGVVGLTQLPGGLGPADPAEGQLDSFARLDLDRWAVQQDGPVEPVWLLLEAMDPPQEPGVVIPVPTELPTPSQNFSYMVQWWLFAVIFGVGYLLILRKVARTRSGRDKGIVAPDEPPPPIPRARGAGSQGTESQGTELQDPQGSGVGG